MLGGDHAGRPGGRHDDVGLAADLDHVGGAGVGQRDGGVGASAAEQQLHGEPDQRRTADHDRSLADGLDAVALQQADDAQRGGRDVAGKIAYEAAERLGGQAVDVFFGRQHGQHRLGIEMVGHRQLAEDAVHRRVGHELGDGGFDLGLGGVAGKADVARDHAGFFGLAMLHPDVDLAGLVVADEHRGQADRWVACSGDRRGQTGDGLVSESVAVEQDRTTGGVLDRTFWRCCVIAHWGVLHGKTMVRLPTVKMRSSAQ